MALTLRGSKNFPLTNSELDANFTYLDERIDYKLDTQDFNASTVNALILIGPQGQASGINSSLLRGNAPTNLAENNTIVQRDGSGSFSATTVNATTFNGKATDSAHADTADVATALSATLAVAVGGTGAVNPTAARVNLLALGTAGLEAMTGKLSLAASTTARATMNMPQGVAPTAPVNGDMWITSAGMFYKAGSVVKTITYSDSNITGTSANVTGIVGVINGGTGSANPAIGRANIGAAKLGANSDITSLTGLTTALSAGQGGTGIKNVGPSGNVLMSNGTNWESKSLGVAVPPGAIMAFYRNSAPTGWLELNGQSVNAALYPNLASVLGTSGDFNLPDLRGEFIRGWDHGRGVDAGRVLGSAQADMLESHTHRLRGNDRGNNSPQLSAPGMWNDDAETFATDLDTIEPTGGNETRPRNFAFMYCIKY